MNVSPNRTRLPRQAWLVALRQSWLRLYYEFDNHPLHKLAQPVDPVCAVAIVGARSFYGLQVRLWWRRESQRRKLKRPGLQDEVESTDMKSGVFKR